jgi:hypothetical protein
METDVVFAAEPVPESDRSAHDKRDGLCFSTTNAVREEAFGAMTPKLEYNPTFHAKC